MSEANETLPSPSESNADPAGPAAPPVSSLRAAWDWSRPLLILLFVLTSFRSAVADWNDVPSGSMKPTILEGDRVFVNKIAYDLRVPFTLWRIARWGDPERGDIVVLRSPENGRRLIKRVVGIPGDEVSLRRNRLYVNGRPAEYAPIDETIPARLHEEDRAGRKFEWEAVDGRRHPIMTRVTMGAGHFGPYRVPEGQYFMMGDNRDESKDSRSIGPVPRDLILGRSEGVAFSLDRSQGWKIRVRWNRMLEGWDQ